MAEDLYNLQIRTDIKEIVTDEGYIGPTGNEAAEKHNIKQSVTAFRGRKKYLSRIRFTDDNIRAALQMQHFEESKDNLILELLLKVQFEVSFIPAEDTFVNCLLEVPKE